MRRALGVVAALVAVAAGCSSFSGNAAPASTAPDGGAPADAAAPTESGPVSCGDLDSSSTNCGRCGHSCLGGQCLGGLCQALQLASFIAPTVVNVPASNPRVVADATHVAWLRNNPSGEAGGSLDICPIAGCPSAGPAAYPYNGGPQTMAANAAAIYANFEGGDNSIVVEVDSDGAPRTIVSATDSPDSQALYATATDLFFLDYYDYINPAATGIYDYSATGPHVFAPLDHDSAANYDHRWTNLFVVADVAYIVENNEIGRSVRNDNIEPDPWCPGGCNGGILGTATDGTSVFWSDQTSHLVRSCTLGGTTCDSSKDVTSSSSFVEQPGRLAHDGTQLYIVTAPNPSDKLARLYGCPAGGCATHLDPITTAIDFYGDVWTTGDAIYWIADMGLQLGGNGTDHEFHVMRIAH